MAELMKQLGWIAWCLTVMGWFLSPIISLLVNKLFPYVVFDASKKLKELENEIIRELKKKVSAAEEQTILRAAEDEGSQSDLKILESLKVDLKAALYEAEDILDLLEYRRIEKGLPHGDDDSIWVENQLAAACAWIARCKGSCFGRWMHVTVAAVIKGAQSLTQSWYPPLGQLFTILQCAQSWYPQLGQLFRSVPLLPVSINPTGEPPSLGSRGSESVLAGPARPAEETEEEIVEEPQAEDGEDNEERKEGESTSVSLLRRCAGSMLTWYAKACFHRDWSYEIVGIKSDKKDSSAVESLVPITQRISLKNRIKHIEDILNTSKKSDLLNDENSSSGTTNDNDKESSSEQKEIDVLYRSIEQKVFGRDEIWADIIRMLHKGPDTNAPSSSTVSPYSVIGIYGITGSGKSTLAQYVCQYEMGEGYFNPIMFILVGKKFSIGNIFRDMLEQITQSQPPKDKGSITLKTELEKKLEHKRFLLVLDDLCVKHDDQKELNILLDMLSTAQRGSGVLVTSQNRDAAQALGAQEQISIPDLEEGVYLSLFMHHARPDASADDREYERLGTKIANKLCRSPIAAVKVGQRLRWNKSISFWETTSNLDVLKTTMGALWWCYQQLSVDMRRCFAYCSTFPRGYAFKQDELVHIWIAQGFVNKGSDKEEEEDIGQSYFNQLVTFLFLEAEGKIFRIHDLLHELAERVSGSEFFRIGLDDSPEHIPQGVRHLFIETTYGVKIAEKLVEAENLRTLIIKELSIEDHESERLLERLFMRLTKLRVLTIEQNYFAQELSVPACIDRMKHLRYLGLRFHDELFLVMILPSTFSKLYHIETIDFPVGTEFRCPEDIANLTNLRHIPYGLNFPNIGRLTSLRTSRRFSVKEEQGYRLKQLKHLNKLADTLIIDCLGVVRSKEEALEAHLTHKKRLRYLELNFGRSKDRFGPDVEAEVLEGLCPPEDLQKLSIKNYTGSRYPSWMLSTPEQLLRLELCRCSQVASIPKGSKLFSRLRKLCIDHCDWDSLPENMERLASLEELAIWWCNKTELLVITLFQPLKKIDILMCNMLRSIEFIWEKEERLEACTSLEYCQHTAPPYPMMPRHWNTDKGPCLVNLEIRGCPILETLTYLPPSLKNLSIWDCGKICYVSGQLGQLEELHIYRCNKLVSVNSLGDASSLKTLSLCGCQCLASLGSRGGPASYLALQKLEIVDCPTMDMKQINKNVLDRLGGGIRGINPYTVTAYVGPLNASVRLVRTRKPNPSEDDLRVGSTRQVIRTWKQTTWI